MPLSWVAALKKWNEGKGKWCIPKKGSEDYEAVRKIMAGGSVPRSRSSSPAPAPKKKTMAGTKLPAEQAAKVREQIAAKRREMAEAEKTAARAAAGAGGKLPLDLVRDILAMAAPTKRVKEMRKVVMEKLTDAQEDGHFYDDWLDYDEQFPVGLMTGKSHTVDGVVPDYGAESGTLTGAIANIITELHESPQYAELSIKEIENPKGLKKKLKKDSEAANGFDAVGDSDVFQLTYSLKGTPAQLKESHAFFKDLNKVVEDVLAKIRG